MKNEKLAFVYCHEPRPIQQHLKYDYKLGKYNNCKCAICKSNCRFFSSHCEIAAEGLEKLGYKIIKFWDKKQLENLPLTKKTPVKATCGVTRYAFHILGVPQPPNVDIPDSLKKFANRKIWTTTLGEVRKAYKENPETRIFIKPLLIQKAFKGQIFFDRYTWDNEGNRSIPRSHSRDEEYLDTKIFNDDFPILAQEPVNFSGSEFRYYVLNRKIFSLKNPKEYYSSYAKLPKISSLKEIVKAYKDQPVGFSFDVGWIVNPKTNKEKLSLVEVNEGFSSGNLYLDDIPYAKMIEARWLEITSQKYPTTTYQEAA